MNISIRSYVLGVSLLLGLAQFSCAKPAPNTKKPVQQAKPIYTKEQAQAYMEEVLPLVEQATGKKFISRPKLKLVTTKELTPILAEELIPQYKAMMPQTSARNIEITAEVTADAYSQGMLGKYGTKTKTLYMLPWNYKPLKAVAQADGVKYYQDIAKLFMAHELTHALQDQEIGLSKLLGSIHTPEVSVAVNATIEGHAMFIEDKVAEAMKLDEVEKRIARGMALGMQNAIDPVDKISYDANRQMLVDTYLRGRDFFAWHYNQGGNERVWQILSSPPTNTSIIFHPEGYTVSSVKETDYSSLLKGLDKRFGNRKWEVRNEQIGELMLRSAYSRMDATKRDAMLANIVHVQSFFATDYDMAATISVFILKDKVSAASMVDSIEEMTRLNVESIRKSKKTTVEAIRFEGFSKIRADIARKISLTTKTKGVSRTDMFYHILRGKAVIEIWLGGVNFTDSQVASVADEVFRRLSRMEQQ